MEHRHRACVLEHKLAGYKLTNLGGALNGIFLAIAALVVMVQVTSLAAQTTTVKSPNISVATNALIGNRMALGEGATIDQWVKPFSFSTTYTNAGQGLNLRQVVTNIATSANGYRWDGVLAQTTLETEGSPLGTDNYAGLTVLLNQAGTASLDHLYGIRSLIEHTGDTLTDNFVGVETQVVWVNGQYEDYLSGLQSMIDDGVVFMTTYAPYFQGGRQHFWGSVVGSLDPGALDLYVTENINTIGGQYIASISNSGGGVITNAYGLKVENQSVGQNNWAIKTGTGKVEFGDDLRLTKTITPAATTGNQTINKSSGSVNFAAAAQSITVTCNLVTANSIIMATVATDDTTAKSCIAVPGSGSFVLKLNAATTSETRVNFLITN